MFIILIMCNAFFTGAILATMAIGITKAQKQELGQALEAANYKPADDFLYLEEKKDDDNDIAVLTNRNTMERFTFYRQNNAYMIEFDVAGNSGVVRKSRTPITWARLIDRLTEWALEIKREEEAVDPWAQAAEDLANDDSYFTAIELPQVDHAIDDSISELKKLALENGKKIEEIQDDINSVTIILKKSARSSTKKEWMAIFKGIVIEKMVDWGLQTALFGSILHVLINSVQDISQLVHHASKLLPG